MDLHQRLAEIREQQGRDPLPDPTKIEGFGPGHPPSPGTRPTVQTEWPGDAQEPETYDDPQEASPLIPKPDYVVKKVEPPALNKSALDEMVSEMPTAGVFVLDSHASFRGFVVSLTTEEQDAVAGVIVKAVRRRLDELSKPVIEQAKEALAPKKRGRPRKVKP